MIENDDDLTDPLQPVPLVLDVDGTLLRTDLLYETFWAALGHNFFATLRVLLTCWTSPARLKRQLRSITDPRVDLLPVRQPVLDLAHKAAGEGRAVHLASGSDQGLVEAVADRFGLAGAHFGSDEPRNLTDGTKARFLTDRFGNQGFDYAGNSWADLKSWEQARNIIAVNPGGRLSTRIRALGKSVTLLNDKSGIGALLKELRPHHWVKNLLLFLPLLVTHNVHLAGVLWVLIAAVAFSIGASTIYIVNDLLDLDADRLHPEKRNRPIASGALPIRTAMFASVFLGLGALGLAYLVSPGVAVLTGAYMASSLIYSLWLKKLRWIDILTLASLFLLRVLTGAAASHTAVSGWLLAFVFAVFFTLACVKRMTGLVRATRDGRLPGRGYTSDDLAPMERAASTSVALAMVFFVTYVFSDTAAGLYTHPVLLASAVIPIALWLVRVVKLSERGREDYDPIKFVLQDKIGLALAAAGVVITLLAV